MCLCRKTRSRRCYMPYNSKTYVDLLRINQTLIDRHNLKEFDYALNARKVLQQYPQLYTPTVRRLLKHSILVRNRVAHFSPITEKEHQAVLKLLTLIRSQHSVDNPPECNQSPHYPIQP